MAARKRDPQLQLSVLSEAPVDGKPLSTPPPVVTPKPASRRAAPAPVELKETPAPARRKKAATFLPVPPVEAVEEKEEKKAPASRARTAKPVQPQDPSSPQTAKPRSPMQKAAKCEAKGAPGTAPLPPPAAQPAPSVSEDKASRKPAKASKAEPAAPSLHPFRGYRVTLEDGCEAEVRASSGCFYPFDSETVAFYCKDLEIARRIRRRWSETIRVFTQGDEEATLLMPTRLYPEVATLIGVPRRAA